MAAATSEPPAADTLRDTSTKPVVPKPSGTPPRKLVVEDIVKGKGPGAKTGNTVVVHYVGAQLLERPGVRRVVGRRGAVPGPARRRRA